LKILLELSKKQWEELIAILDEKAEELKEKSDGIKWQLRKWEKIGFTKERTKVLKEKIAELDIERSRVHGLKRMLT